MNMEITVRKINEKEIPAVTSLQVAEAFGKQHSHVLRDLRNIIENDEDGFALSNFGECSYTNENNREMPMYAMSKDGFVLLVMGYTGAEAMRLKKAYITEFNRMEAELQNRLPDVPNFSNPALAARAWADQYERRQIAEAQRDEAIRTKAQIGSKREATAMATASAAIRKVNSLENELGRGKLYKAVKGIPWLLDEFEPSKGMYSVIGKALKKLSAELGYSVEKIIVPEFPDGINAYHVDVIAIFRKGLNNPEAFFRYRKRKAA